MLWDNEPWVPVAPKTVMIRDIVVILETGDGMSVSHLYQALEIGNDDDTNATRTNRVFVKS
jgi:hypothetical protein